jgi:hypothetical protein
VKGRWSPEALAKLISKGSVSVVQDTTGIHGAGTITKKKRKPNKKRNEAAHKYLQDLSLLGVPDPTPEYMFHDHRRWRFDWAWPSVLVAVEYEGGIYTGGRHTRGEGFEEDCIKYNTATASGWSILRITHRLAMNGQAATFTEALLMHRQVFSP